MNAPDTPGDALRTAAVVGVIAAVLVSPWLFGAAEPWAWLTMCLLVGAGTACWLVSLVRGSAGRLRAPALSCVLLVLMAFVGVQSLPLPPAVVGALSPASARLHREASDLLARAGAGQFLPHGVAVRAAPSLSAAPLATRRSLYLLTAYVGTFLVLANGLRSWSAVGRTAAVLVAGGFLMAVLGLAQEFSGTRSIYWFHVPRFGGDIFGPFTNRNHFAAHVNMTLGVAVGLLLATAHGDGAASGASHGRPGWRERLAGLSTSRGGRAALLGFAAAVMGASVCVTLSRAGILSMALAALAVGGVAAGRRALPGRGAAVGAVALLMLATVAWLGWRPVVERMGTLANVAEERSGSARVVATLGTLEVFGRWPAVGCGFGAFQHAFPRFQDPAIQFGRWLHAHNDYAQLLAEGGAVGAAIALAAAALLAAAVWKRFARAPARGRMMAAGLAFGLLTIAVHSLFDYSLHKPANALRLAALCGMAVAAVHLHRPRRRGEETDQIGAEHGFALAAKAPR